MAVHALVTGPIAGRIPVDGHPDGHVDVTPDQLYFDDSDSEMVTLTNPDGEQKQVPALLAAVAEAIDAEHRVRGTHPEQVEG